MKKILTIIGLGLVYSFIVAVALIYLRALKENQYELVIVEGSGPNLTLTKVGKYPIADCTAMALRHNQAQEHNKCLVKSKAYCNSVKF